MNKTAFVTGATSGFGEAIARELASKGARLIIAGRRKERLAKIASELETSYHCEVLSVAFDIQDQQAVEQAVSSLPTKWKSIDILINNAGCALGKKNLEHGDLADWNGMIDTNIKGLLYMTRALLPALKNSHQAHIVNIGSIAGTEVYSGGNVYCASKHAVNALNKAMRIELLPYGIRVSQIRPGLAQTEFSLTRFKGDEHQAKDVYKGYQPLEAQDIARIVLFVIESPKHVCINDLEVTPTAQANAYILEKSS